MGDQLPPWLAQYAQLMHPALGGFNGPSPLMTSTYSPPVFDGSGGNLAALGTALGALSQSGALGGILGGQHQQQPQMMPVVPAPVFNGAQSMPRFF